MPVVVSCRCGQRFAAQDHLVGRQVPCPACGNPLAIAAGPSAAPGIVVTCTCGRAFLAPESLRGMQTNCPGCTRVIRVPPARTDSAKIDDLFVQPGRPPGIPLASPLHRDSEIPW